MAQRDMDDRARPGQSDPEAVIEAEFRLTSPKEMIETERRRLDANIDELYGVPGDDVRYEYPACLE